MVDFGEETREQYDESDLAVPTPSSIGYYQGQQIPRLSSWRQSGQELEPIPRQNVLGSHRDFVLVKNDPENLSRFSNTVNTLSAIGAITSLPTDTAEDNRLKGQLLQEITRAAETFEPYDNSSLSSNYRSYNLVSDMPHSSDVDYAFSETSQWMWPRTASDERHFSGASSNSMVVETTVGTVQYPVSSQLVSEPFSSSFPPLTVSEGQSSIPSSTSMVQQTQKSVVSPSALDLSPVSPVQVSSLNPSQASHVPVLTSSSHQLLPSENQLNHFNTGTQEELSYHHDLEGNISLAPPEEENEENPDDVLAYPPEMKCDGCESTFSHVQHLKQHMHHCNSAPVVADSCLPTGDGKSSDGASEQNIHKLPQRHQAGHHSSSFKRCDETISKPENLKVQEKSFRCNECTTTCSTKTMLARHKKMHTGEKPYSCGECKTSFTEPGSLKVHMRQHTGDRPYKCSFCNEAFSCAGMLATHKRKHTGEKPYVCSDCGASFRLLSTLKSHNRRHTGEKPFSCELCGNSFTQKAALRRHKRTHLNIRPYECDQCGFKFREKENLRRHVLLHKIDWPFVCDICGAGFNHSKKLETHRMLHNGGDRPYKCNKCSSCFVSPKYLTQHKKRVHDRKGSIKCEECNATFNRKETLQSHSRIHKGSHQYVCVHCGAAFNQRATLTRHTRIHENSKANVGSSSEENYVCKFCKKVFTTKTSLDSHMETHMVEDFEYECPSCHSRFSDQFELAKHNDTHHQTVKRVSDVNEEDRELIRDMHVCKDCDQTFLRKWQLRAHRRYCLCKDLDAIDEPVDVKPNISSQNSTKEVNAMELVSAVLAVTSSGPSNEINYQNPSNSELSPVSVPLTVASTSSSHQSQHCTSAQISLPHSTVYEQLSEIPQEIYQQPAHEDPQHSANVNVMQSLQEALGHNSDRDMQQQSQVRGETQGTVSQHSMHENMQHQSFSFDISQADFYKSVPSLQSSSQEHNDQHYNHSNTIQETPLLHGSVLQDISQELDSCEHLHLSMRHSSNVLNNHREHVQEAVHYRGQQRLGHIEDKSKEQENESFSPHSEAYQITYQDQFHPHNHYRLSKISDKYANRNEQQTYILQDHVSSKLRSTCPKLLGSYNSLRNKY